MPFGSSFGNEMETTPKAERLAEVGPTIESEAGEAITCEVDPETVEVGNFPEMVDVTSEKETIYTRTKKNPKPKYARAVDRKGEKIFACTPPTLDAVGGAATAISLGDSYKLLIYPDGKQVFTRYWHFFISFVSYL